MDYAPFWPFPSTPELKFARRGEVLKLSHPDYDGIFDDIDLEYDVQLALAGHEYEAQISMNEDKWRAEVYFRNYSRCLREDLPTKEEAIAWCAANLPKLKEIVDAALALSAKVEGGLHLLQDNVTGIWLVVGITHENGFAKIWYVGSECPDDIEDVWHDTLTPLVVTAPDGSIVGE